MIVKNTYVHEFLCRFDRDGFRAAHIGRVQELLEDGVPMPGATKLLDPQPVTPQDADALAQIGASIDVGALALVASLTGERDALAASLKQTEGERDQALAEIQALRAKYEPA